MNQTNLSLLSNIYHQYPLLFRHRKFSRHILGYFSTTNFRHSVLHGAIEIPLKLTSFPQGTYLT